MTDNAKLETVLARFEKAMSRFETKLDQKILADQDLIVLSKEAINLRKQQASMNRDLELVKNKAAELVDTSKQAAGKIDSAMSRIRSVLHSNSGGN